MAHKTKVKKSGKVDPVSQPAAETGEAMPGDLSEVELDLLSHLQNGYELETDTLGGDVLLRNSKDNELIRPLSATRNTIKALENRALIMRERGDDPLRITWKLQARARDERSHVRQRTQR
jgi:hypothetical protein